MQFTISTIAAIAAFIGSSSAHMIMHEPLQWTVPGEALAPLEFDGSDFPCANAYSNTTAAATYTAGGTGKLVTQGSAVHGGGSGQMVITYDFPPTANSVWRVMQSWEGDHPIKADGNLPADPTLLHDPIDFAIPAGLPSGTAVVAWTWFNRIGNREMYMKCATAQIDGVTSSVSDLNNDPGMLALPTFFRANSGNGCEVPENIDAIAFKNPGANLVLAGGYTPTSISCDDSEAGSGSASASTTAAGTVALPATSTLADIVSSVVAVPTAATTTYAGSGDEAGNSGDNGAEPTNIYTTTTVFAGAPAVTTTAAAVATTAAAATTAATTTAAAATSVAAEGTCVEGAITCNSDGTWSMCGSGYVQNMGAVAAGMKCENGAFYAANSKRSVRFSPAHMRRRHN
jgi:hypothetical protein